jgi:integrase
VKLTASTIGTLSLPAGQADKIFFDSELHGFGLRLRSSGAKSWIVQYAVAKKTRRIVLGSDALLDPGKARETAKDILAAVRLGRDPKGEMADSKAKSGETFDACMRLYLDRRRNDVKLRASSYAEIERHLVKNLKALHGLRIDKVDRRSIALELGRFATERGPVQANRTRASLVKFLNWCAGEGFIDANPAMFTNKNPEQARDRVLTMSELAAIWRTLPDGDFGDIVRLLTLTGQRAREISDLRWEEIDLDRAVITLPPQRTKNRRWHTIPLAPAAVDLLKARQRVPGRDLVFGIGMSLRHGFSGWNAAKKKLDEKLTIKHWVVHDLRRAVATGLGELGIAPYAIEGVLNHVSGTRGGVGARYNKAVYEAEKTTALLRWGEHLMAAVEGRDTSVTPFKREAGGS